jgi:hypothetical protein
MSPDPRENAAVMRSASGGRRWAVGLVAASLVLAALAIGGIGWAVWWINDNIEGPGPGPTGSGPCTSADAVNIQMVFADGHTVDACTRDRPACPNQTITGADPGQTSSVSQFGLHNQLRSSSRRYILTMNFDAALPADAAESTLQISPSRFLPGSGQAGNGALTTALVTIAPRDPTEDGFTPDSGSVTVSSSKGVAQGQIDGHFNVGPTRPDRPAPTPATASPVRVTGTFACSH